MMKTLVWRHRKENLKKCSLRGLESREDFEFYTYPNQELPDLSQAIVLKVEAPPLTAADREKQLVILDGTWRYAERMLRQLPEVEFRSLPSGWKTAYPRRQDEEAGLASIEAVYVAYKILGKNIEGLLDSYHWAQNFLEMNNV